MMSSSPLKAAHTWLFDTHPKAGVAVSRSSALTSVHADLCAEQLMYGTLNAIGDTLAQTFFVCFPFSAEARRLTSYTARSRRPRLTRHERYDSGSLASESLHSP